MFSLDVSFRANDQEKFKTWFGTLVSFFIIVVVVSYSHIKLETLVEYQDTRFSEIEVEREEPMYFEGGN